MNVTIKIKLPLLHTGRNWWSRFCYIHRYNYVTSPGEILLGPLALGNHHPIGGRPHQINSSYLTHKHDTITNCQFTFLIPCAALPHQLDL